MPLVVPVILGSVRADRQGLRAARFVIAARKAAASRRRWSTRPC